MTLSVSAHQLFNAKNLLGSITLCFFVTQPWDRHLADVYWLLLSLVSFIYLGLQKYQGHDNPATPKTLKTILWLFVCMPVISIISYLTSPLDTLPPEVLEPDARWLLIIAIILAMRNARIGPKWILLFIASYAISTFISAVMETNYLRALGARANGDENAVPYGMFNATIALMLLVFFINPNLNKLFSQEPNKTPENNNRKNVIIRSLLFLLFTLSVIAAFLSGTRAAVLLLPVVMIGLYIIRYPIKKALIGLTIILGLGTVLITQSKSVLVYKLISTPTTVTSYFVNNDRASKLKNQRLEQWKESACIFTLHPLLGTGPRSFKYAHQTYGSENYCNAVQFLKQGSDQAHSVYFNTLGTLGLAGIITTLLLSLALLRSGINASQQANPTSKLGGSLLITVLACHAINGITLDLWFMNHMMDKNLLVLALPLLLIFHNRAPSKES